jgi:hypothetical protein
MERMNKISIGCNSENVLYINHTSNNNYNMGTYVNPIASNLCVDNYENSLNIMGVLFNI